MNVKRLITLAAIALLPIAAGATTSFVVPAAGTGPGANGSQWQSELTLHSSSNSAMLLQLTFHDRNGAAETSSVTLAPRTTVAIADIVKSHFHRDAATGAIEIAVDDAFANRLAIASRTFNASENGEFGQDIPAINVADASVAGDNVIIAAPASVADNRFNAGLYAASAATVRWDLLRADGTLVKSVQVDYAAGTQTQYGNAVETLFGASPANSDTLQAAVTKGAIVAYGSAINNRTGDPTYVPGVDTASDIRIKFLGVDSNLDNNIEIADANQDGVLDAPLTIYSSSPWPNTFRVLVDSNNATFELLTQRTDLTISPDGYVIWKASGNVATDTLKIRVTVDGVSEIVTIPIKFL